MMLLTPLIMAAIFGSMLWRSGTSIPEPVRPLVAIGAMVFVLFGVLQLMGNQFGFDRDGFRVFVLCAAPRRDILLGKNLAFAPLALGIAAILLTVVQVVCPMRLDHFLAMFPQYRLDVPAVLHFHEPDVDLRADPRRRGLAEAVESEVDARSSCSW